MSKILLKAQIVGYSSVVGGGLALHDEKGACRFIVNIIGTTQGVTRKENDELCEQLLDAINFRRGGLAVSPREE